MAAIKSSSNITGVTYAVLDADSNDVILVNGQPIASRPLQPQALGGPTAQFLISGSTLRLTQANAAAWPYSAGQAFTDADNGYVTFIAAPAIYAGGSLSSANSGGVRMQFKGLFCDFTSTNLTDLGTPLAAFAASGAVT